MRPRVWAALACAIACAKPTPAPRTLPEVEAALRKLELSRTPSAEVRALLDAPEAPVRVRAALAAGRIHDPGALARLGELLLDAEAGAVAAWALGRIEGGHERLIRCVAERCPSIAAAARALSGPAAPPQAAIDALVPALDGPAAREAALSLGVLARSKDVVFSPRAHAGLAAALGRDETRAAAAYALSRLPRLSGEGYELLEAQAALRRAMPALAAAMRGDADGWTRAMAARAWGRQGFPDEAALQALQDPDWRVRVEAARGLAAPPEDPRVGHAQDLLDRAFAGQTSPHVIVALADTAVQMLAMAPDPARFSDPVSRCAVALARDRVRKELVDTPGCEGAGWLSRARTGALAAELGLPQAQQAFRDPDGRVRGAAAGAVVDKFADDLRKLLADADPYVVQDAAAALARFPADPSTKDAALEAAGRLAAAHAKGAGDPESDALAALAPLAGAMPKLLPTPNVTLARALGAPRGPIPLPAEAVAMPGAHLLRVRTSKGELLIDLRPDLAPFTASAVAELARRGFYDKLSFHRVVPDFVVQGGDPRGDGDGGPGWALPDEHSPVPFLRGTVGIATSGPETGGSQFFLCHSPQPHLDGRYTVAGQLRSGDEVLDALQPGDTIVSATAE